MLKFHCDPIVNESEIVIFYGIGLVVCGKREGFGRKRRENEIERKRRAARKGDSPVLLSEKRMMVLTTAEVFTVRRALELVAEPKALVTRTL